MLKKTLSVFLVLCLALSTLCMGLGASLAAAEDAENGIYLSDIEWESWAMYGAKSTDANPAYRPSRDSEEHGGKLTIAGKQYDKGLRTHPDPSYPADIVYDISSYGCNVFTAIAGKDSAGGGPGVVQFQVLLDGEMIAQSPLVGPGEIYEFNCSIAGGSKLTLRVTDGGDGLMYDSSAWGNAMIRKDTQEEVQDVNITTYGTPIVCCTDPKGQGNKDIGVICDGVFPELPGSGAQQYDTWGSTSHEGNCYFGMEFNGLCDFTRFVYQTGMHFPDGGWFISEGLKLQVRQNGEWVDAPGYTVSPELPGNTASEDREGSFAVYTFTFQTAVKADAIRIMGAVGGFTSCAEIAVYATAEPEEPDEPLDPEAGIYLSDIEWESWAMYCAHSTDASPAYRPSRDSEEHGGKITIAGQQYDKGLRTHPDASYPADIVYDISGYDCNVFTATVGKDNAGIVGGAQFQVLLDGEVIAQSDILGPGESHEFRCDIAGGSKLTLRVTDGGDGITGDSVAWGNAMIRKEVVEPKPDPEAGIYLSDIEWESWAMYASKSTDEHPMYTPSRDSEENGGKITIAGQQYDKGLRTHPDPSYPADIVYDISDYGCNLFTATVGKDSAGLIGVVQFQVLLDGELIAQSPLVGPNESNPSYDLACSIAGGSKLTLRVTDGGDGTMADSSAWANAMIRKGTAQEEAQTVIGTIATIGEVTKDNYESKKAAIDIAEAALAVYDKAHGEDSDVLALITNRQALADAKAAYDKFGTEPDEPLDPEAGIYLSDIEWESWAMYASKSTDAAPAYTPSRDSEENGGKITIAGQQYDKGLRTHPDASYPADIVYDISSYGCNVFTAIAGKDSAGVVGGAQFQVLLDGEVIAQSEILGPGASHEFRCNIAGGSKLTLRVTDGGDGITGDSVAWGNAMIRKETLNLKEEAQTVIDAIHAIGEVTKENYESKKAAIDLAEIALKGYDKAHSEDSDALALITNRQALADAKAAYDKFSTEPDEPFDPKVGIYLSDIEWESWVMIGGKSTDAAPPYTPSRNSEENGGKITIAGKQYDKGLRTHPDNDTPADIVYDISRYECTTFSAVVGKDSAGSMGNVQFIVLLDDKVIAESPLLYPGEDSTIECDITGGSKLTLRVTCGDDGYMGDSSAWGNARIHSNPIVVPDEPRKGWVDTTLNLTVPTGAAYISDMEWESWSMYGATSEDKVPAYEPSFNCNEAGGTLTIAGIEFQKGIRTHVDPSTLLADIVYDISGYEYDLFRAVVGKDSAGPSGNIQFQILVDDVLVVESPILEAGKACMLTVEVAGAKKITLRVRDGRDGIAYDSAGWGNAILYYAPITQANQVVKLIQALPEVDALTIDDQLPLEKAQLAFQNLSSDEKQKVPADLVDKLQALVAKMKGFQELEAVARVVAEQIQALPAKDQLTLRDFDKVKAARAAYEGLTQEQKPYLSESDLAKLTEAEAYLKPLMEAYQTERAAQAQEVIQAIDAIGEITGSNYKEKKELLDAADVALKRYEMLYAGDEEAAGLITNRSTWNDAWEAYQALQNQVKFGDINADGSIDAQDALLALQHSVGLITLTEEQMARADVDGSEQIDAADALLILQRSVDLISQFPIEG